LARLRRRRLHHEHRDTVDLLVEAGKNSTGQVFVVFGEGLHDHVVQPIAEGKSGAELVCVHALSVSIEKRIQR
jgi:hypothetical protein